MGHVLIVTETEFDQRLAEMSANWILCGCESRIHLPNYKEHSIVCMRANLRFYREVVIGENYWHNTDLERHMDCSVDGCTKSTKYAEHMDIVWVHPAEDLNEILSEKAFCLDHRKNLHRHFEEINDMARTLWKVIEL